MQEPVCIDHDSRPNHEGNNDRVLRLDQVSEPLEEQGAYHRNELNHQKDLQQERRITLSRKELLFEKRARRDDHCLNPIVVDQVTEQVTRREWQSSQLLDSCDQL